ncbi:tRNA (adenine(22)-N(1))-methyltransferase TrmK [Marinicellulosiphila megalodicopiae]|uniref:tRNA (adenine(22)-N(1))-methyltransferase TrmK n=1 Tax=Marinicellulosiphila megalodicopiae TaxID=2724896 RepID=UPI003BB1AF50
MQFHQLSPYDDFWDLCCDHGFLGMTLFKNTQNSQIHLVDQVPKIVEILKQKYEKFNDGRALFKTQNATQIILNTNKRHLIVIAGVGGETAIEILESIINKNPKANMDFAISPNSHIFQLRCFLQKHFTLLHEDLIRDGNRFHEHIFVRFTFNQSKRISLTGQGFWQNSPYAKVYQAKLIKHYRLINSHNTNNDKYKMSKQALEYYSNLAL